MIPALSHAEIHFAGLYFLDGLQRQKSPLPVFGIGINLATQHLTQLPADPCHHVPAWQFTASLSVQPSMIFCTISSAAHKNPLGILRFGTFVAPGNHSTRTIPSPLGSTSAAHHLVRVFRIPRPTG